MTVVLWHNPRCRTSREVLALIEGRGITPTIRFYLEDVPGVVELAEVIGRAGLSVRDAIRRKEPAFAARGLSDPALSDADLLEAMVADPILIERPFVIAPGGVRLCRPAALVVDIL
ncbi:arsenate reductase [Ameyamaea chiangmaiensis NBRC 103196]|uniref:Arsenate reductase n=1 Tax=Ameyamaea chiangmaiensis TaxID=442969 RepID=A0A850P6Y3_9PROT|nr:arsenate reductase (glutaredoxin) [Ameyamaea chiangmaiensis]MBS4076241.1 arsenate reductase (glutaredoxin) [Ameyamaea chiangmaiensis]NVN39698.1 arsenate reductase (glutaredoxin) [Ameyamaea chiangmaiensis]GBQ64680.1 arsenate reductase [Ameyamaea chiangmaiensis NBRC 103196]